MTKTKSPGITTLSELSRMGHIEEEKLPELEKVVDRFQLSITSQMAELLVTSGAITRQFVPSAEELVESEGDRDDPIGDQSYQPVKGIIHRYADRCLLLPLTVCPLYCRFCFRREKVGDGRHSLSRQELQEALDYITAHTEIWEVILSGGDPLFLPPKTLGGILKKLAKIEHVEVLRLHTRVPVVDSARINEAMLEAMKVGKPVYVVLHANHPKEFTHQSRACIARLVDNGIPMLSQSVLLKGVNDDPEVLGDLMREFVRNRVKPYYLHHADLAKGTRHFRTTVKAGQSLIKQLRGRFSGLCQPTYVLDIPGGYGKVPLHPTYLDSEDEKTWKVEDPEGNVHYYRDSHHSLN